MTHAEKITDCIPLLDGLSNYPRLFSLNVGQTFREQFERDLRIEMEVFDRLRPGTAICRERHDTTSAILLEAIMAAEEDHIDYLQTQLALMDTLGELLYLARCAAHPPALQLVLHGHPTVRLGCASGGVLR